MLDVRWAAESCGDFGLDVELELERWRRLIRLSPVFADGSLPTIWVGHFGDKSLGASGSLDPFWSAPPKASSSDKFGQILIFETFSTIVSRFPEADLSAQSDHPQP